MRGLPAEGVGRDLGSAAGEGFPLKEGGSGSQLPESFEQTHQDGIGMRKIRILTLKLVCPFLAVEKVIAVPPDNHQHRQESIAWIVFAAVKHRLDDIGLIGWA